MAAHSLIRSSPTQSGSPSLPHEACAAEARRALPWSCLPGRARKPAAPTIVHRAHLGALDPAVFPLAHSVSSLGYVALELVCPKAPPGQLVAQLDHGTDAGYGDTPDIGAVRAPDALNVAEVSNGTLVA